MVEKISDNESASSLEGEVESGFSWRAIDVPKTAEEENGDGKPPPVEGSAEDIYEHVSSIAKGKEKALITESRVAMEEAKAATAEAERAFRLVEESATDLTAKGPLDEDTGETLAALLRATYEGVRAAKELTNIGQKLVDELAVLKLTKIRLVSAITKADLTERFARRSAIKAGEAQSAVAGFLRLIRERAKMFGGDLEDFETQYESIGSSTPTLSDFEKGTEESGSCNGVELNADSMSSENLTKESIEYLNYKIKNNAHPVECLEEPVSNVTNEKRRFSDEITVTIEDDNFGTRWKERDSEPEAHILANDRIQVQRSESELSVTLEETGYRIPVVIENNEGTPSGMILLKSQDVASRQEQTDYLRETEGPATACYDIPYRYCEVPRNYGDYEESRVTTENSFDGKSVTDSVLGSEDSERRTSMMSRLEPFISSLIISACDELESNENRNGSTSEDEDQGDWAGYERMRSRLESDSSSARKSDSEEVCLNIEDTNDKESTFDLQIGEYCEGLDSGKSYGDSEGLERVVYTTDYPERAISGPQSQTDVISCNGVQDLQLETNKLEIKRSDSEEVCVTIDAIKIVDNLTYRNNNECCEIYNHSTPESKIASVEINVSTETTSAAVNTRGCVNNQHCTEGAFGSDSSSQNVSSEDACTPLKERDDIRSSSRVSEIKGGLQHHRKLAMNTLNHFNLPIESLDTVTANKHCETVEYQEVVAVQSADERRLSDEVCVTIDNTEKTISMCNITGNSEEDECLQMDSQTVERELLPLEIKAEEIHQGEAASEQGNAKLTSQTPIRSDHQNSCSSCRPSVIRSISQYVDAGSNSTKCECQAEMFSEIGPPLPWNNDRSSSTRRGSEELGVILENAEYETGWPEGGASRAGYPKRRPLRRSISEVLRSIVADDPEEGTGGSSDSYCLPEGVSTAPTKLADDGESSGGFRSDHYRKAVLKSQLSYSSAVSIAGLPCDIRGFGMSEEEKFAMIRAEASAASAAAAAASAVGQASVAGMIAATTAKALIAIFTAAHERIEEQSSMIAEKLKTKLKIMRMNSRRSSCSSCSSKDSSIIIIGTVNKKRWMIGTISCFLFLILLTYALL